jgi:hypothetical protein
VLAIVNELNAPKFSDPVSRQLTASRPADERKSMLFDVNGDGYATPLDVLAVVNRINRSAASQPATGQDASPLPLPAGTPAGEFIPPTLNGVSLFPRRLPDGASASNPTAGTGQGEQSAVPASQPLPPTALTAPFGSRSDFEEADTDLERVLDDIATDVLAAWTE